jgi:hypothetical protein
MLRAPRFRSGRRLFGVAPAFASTSKEKRTPRNPVALVLLKRRNDFLKRRRTYFFFFATAFFFAFFIAIVVTHPQSPQMNSSPGSEAEPVAYTQRTSPPLSSVIFYTIAVLFLGR